MFKMQDVRFSDARKLLLAFFAVAVMLLVSFAVLQSDSSDADSVDGTKYFYNKFTHDESREIYDAAVNGYSVSLGEYPNAHPLKGQPALVTTFSVPLHVGDDVNDVQTNYAAGFEEVMPFFLNEVVTYFWFGNYWTYSLAEVMYDSSNKIVGTDNHGNPLHPHIQFYVYSDVMEYGTTTPAITSKLNELKTAIHDTALPDTSSRYATVKSIHDVVCGMLSYDKTTPDGMMCRNVYTAMLGSHTVVCEGYAKTFKALCDEHNVPCIIVTGDGINKDGEKEGHMWNYVQMENGNWYLVDCTWDDQDTLRDTYFLAGSDSDGFYKKVAQDHIANAEKYLTITLPALNVKAFVNDKFTITFLDYFGEEIEKIGNLDFDAPFPVPPAIPDHSTNERYVKTGTFTFKNWGVETLPATVTDNATYTATYVVEKIEYTIRFVFDNGSEDFVKTYNYEDEIEVPADPVKPATDKYVYKFTKWTPVVDKTVVGNKTFTANYSCTISEKVEASAGFTLDAATKSLLASADKLSVTFVDGSSLVAYIVFDKTAATALVEGETLTVKKLDVSAVDPAVQDQLKGATIWDIDFGANNSVFSSGKANVNLHYKRGAADYVGLDFYFVNGDKLDKLTYNYDTENDCIVFDTTHFSTYAAQNSLSNVNWSEYYPVFIIIAVALALFVVIYRFS